MLPSTVFIKKSNTHFYKVSVRNDVRRGKKVKHHKRISKDTYLKHKRSLALQVGSGQVMSVCTDRNKQPSNINNIIKLIRNKYGEKYAKYSQEYYDNLSKKDKTGLIKILQIEIDKECLKNNANHRGSSWHRPLFIEKKNNDKPLARC